MTTSQKEEAIASLITLLNSNLGGKSILLEMESKRTEGDPRPDIMHQWAKARTALGLQGYTSHDTVRRRLQEAFK